MKKTRSLSSTCNETFLEVDGFLVPEVNIEGEGETLALFFQTHTPTAIECVCSPELISAAESGKRINFTYSEDEETAMFSAKVAIQHHADASEGDIVTLEFIEPRFERMMEKEV